MLHTIMTGTPTALERPPFGQFARRRLPLPAAALDRCLDYQHRHGEKIGKLLVESGLITHHDRLQILRDQARWVAEACRADVPAGVPYPSSLSLCMPAFNEEANIVATIEGACAVLPELVADFEIVVVDDGSDDRTAALVHEIEENDCRIRLLRHECNRGYGSAVSTALQAANGDLVMMMDSDGQFNLLDLPPFLAAIDQHDLAVGYRYRRAEKQLRRFNGWAWTQLVRHVLKVPVRDLDCAFKLFRRDLVEDIEFSSTGAAINAEMMAQCFRRGARIIELPVTHSRRYGGAETGANLGVIARAFKELPRLRRYRTDLAHQIASVDGRHDGAKKPATASVDAQRTRCNGSQNERTAWRAQNQSRIQELEESGQPCQE